MDVVDFGIQFGIQLFVGVFCDLIGLGQVDFVFFGVDVVFVEQVVVVLVMLQDVVQQVGVVGGD